MRTQLQCMKYVMAKCIKHAIAMAFQWESNKIHITQPPLEVVPTISNTHFSSGDIGILSISIEIALRWMLRDLI